ncbi:MAG: TRAP transporter substrate-binding protein [gamma proteobacterium symbiont of Bathyaustriella thionipta]|nr:TRAP transporter substrate-binding protein [gamma proteobacterium symbiont of Bathyaustriella thionipta]MCU7949468.1 TRAP transporter substrate-binding protein [gamma proteobacterium symbiont of Bathyaustriella thionipta]MCU7953113.1 TRAP transporter substrate-binding protein [gamma proteobacterium symbiont of Bathyaustriella thionipta]MCU7956055.1 TRAP transporter substrate-binding protein [gamma proteobacterium symbiont of Bathyaustriella thionipta]MCU7966969.1 TRAP transporter substrate-b
MKRRDFIKGVSAGSVATASMVGGIKTASAAKTIKWKMVTSWPKNFPGLGMGANFLAKTINEMSGGRLKVKVYGANEIVPALEVFDAVSRGTAQMGHSGAYYWKGKHPATQFFTSVPFGLTAQEMNGWLYHGGGMKLWEELYDKFNLIPNAAGNTGVQMGGWFNKEINNVEDLKGLKMRIPGMGGEVLKQAGGTPVTLPGGEIYTSMQSGAIDATEWVGPYNDMAFGLYKVAKFYYHPGWHEPGSTMEAMINKDAFNALPKDLQKIVRAACRVANQDMLADYTARNNQALQTLISKHKVEMRQYPDDVIKKLHALSTNVVAKVGEHDELSSRIHQSFLEFKNNVIQWSRVSEQGYMKARALS